MYAEALYAVLAIIFSVVIWKRIQRLGQLKKLGYQTSNVNFLWGNLLEHRFSGKHPFIVQKEWKEKFGKVYGYYAGSIPRIIISDVRVLNDILVKEFSTFTDRPGMSTTSKMLVNLKGQEWKDVRRIISGSLTSGKFKSVFHIISDSCDTFVEILNGKCQLNESFDVFPLLSAMTLDVISKTALALDLDCQHDNNNVILTKIREFFTSGSEKIFFPLMCFPELKFLFILPYLFMKQRRNQRYVCGKVEEIIATRRSQKESEYSDLLQLLMDATDGGKGGKCHLSDREVVDNAFLFLLAGYETTSNALAYVFYIFAKYPHIQEKVHQEVKTLSSEITYDDLSLLVYTEQVLYETLRFYPPVINFVNRVCKADIEVRGWKIPKDMSVVTDVWNIHHDSDLWENPDEFNPDRFSAENKRQQDPMAFMAFGNGPRNCIGARFAVLESKMCIAKVIQSFEIVRGDGFQEDLPVVIRSIVLMNPVAVPVRLQKRI